MTVSELLSGQNPGPVTVTTSEPSPATTPGANPAAPTANAPTTRAHITVAVAFGWMTVAFVALILAHIERTGTV
jgi:hypothetical protein